MYNSLKPIISISISCSRECKMDKFMTNPATHVDFTTTMGNFTFELYVQYAPKVFLCRTSCTYFQLISHVLIESALFI